MAKVCFITFHSRPMAFGGAIEAIQFCSAHGLEFKYTSPVYTYSCPIGELEKNTEINQATVNDLVTVVMNLKDRLDQLEAGLQK